MAWLQKRPQISPSANYYTVGMNTTLLLVGLGNPEPQYDGTRHNIGFDVLDSFVSRHSEMSSWVGKKDLKCLFSSGRIAETQVLAIKPLTYMNLSGEAVSLTANFYKIKLPHIMVIHDELDITYGQIRTRYGGSAAGHNGIKSISQIIGEDYGRIRIGIGPKKPAEIDSADFVLQQFSKTEQKQSPNLLKESSAILSEFIYNKSITPETRSYIV